jgi:hypothetical protein
MVVVKYVKANELVDVMLSLRRKYADIIPRRCSPRGSRWYIVLDKRKGGMTKEERESVEREFRSECKRTVKERQLRLDIGKESDNGEKF